MQFIPDALAPLTAYRQFICYILTPSKSRPGKQDKLPVDHATGAVRDAHDASIWTDAQTAIAAAARLGANHGVGFVFTDADPFWFLDIDNCRVPVDPANPGGEQTWSRLAQHLFGMFPGAAIEVSSSHKGLHIFGTGTAPAHAIKNVAHGLEFYTSKRFVALTGIHASGNAATDHSAALAQLVETYFPPSAAVLDDGEWTTEPVSEYRGIDDDDRLMELACRKEATAGSAFGNKATFRDLWECNVDVLSKAYPDGGTRDYDASSVDAALALHLAFWTGKNMSRMQRLMERSGLKRLKYERADYLPTTIRKACALQANVLQLSETEPLPANTPVALASAAPRATLVSGSTFLAPDKQIELFAGCVYIVDANAVLVPGGVLLKSDQFRVRYGGYSFVMDNENGRVVRDAYEAFTQSQALRAPRADSTCFRPDIAPAAIVAEDDGRTRANVYWPVEVPRMVGDAAPFLVHVTKLLPDARDREIVLAYMAACVQHKGVKFQWAPLMQGAPGNGKTLLSRCVAAAIGKRYVHWPRASRLAAQFNGWLLNKLFYAVEDIFVADSQLDVIEELKPMITGDDLEIEGKGVNQISADICGNFIFNTNHRDGLRKTKDDRRFAVFFTAQQCVEDIVRDGMSGDYFPNLYGWLDNGGYAIVAEFLHTYPIPDEFNPAKGCTRAPHTSTTDQAIAAGLGTLEQEVLEAIGLGMPGFCGGWISSHYLDELLKDKRRHLALNKRKDMLAALGYVPHPGLTDGRVNNPIAPDNKKSRLYVKRDHAAYHIVGPATIGAAYTQAQLSAMGLGVAVTA